MLFEHGSLAETLFHALMDFSHGIIIRLLLLL